MVAADHLLRSRPVAEGSLVDRTVLAEAAGFHIVVQEPVDRTRPVVDIAVARHTALAVAVVRIAAAHNHLARRTVAEVAVRSRPAVLVASDRLHS